MKNIKRFRCQFKSRNRRRLLTPAPHTLSPLWHQTVYEQVITGEKISFLYLYRSIYALGTIASPLCDLKQGTPENTAHHRIVKSTRFLPLQRSRALVGYPAGETLYSVAVHIVEFAYRGRLSEYETVFCLYKLLTGLLPRKSTSFHFSPLSIKYQPPVNVEAAEGVHAIREAIAWENNVAKSKKSVAQSPRKI